MHARYQGTEAYMNIVDYVILFLIFGVVIALVAGVITMLRGNNPQRSNRMMMWRVILQGAVLVLCGLFLASK